MYNDDGQCQKCGEYYDLRPECDPSILCDVCAQTIVSELYKIVPEPPKAITWEMGVEILNKLQENLYGHRIEEE